MADNVQLSLGTEDGATFASDDIGGIQHQRVKIQYGADGSATDVSDTNPLPIDDAGGSITVDSGAAFTVQEDGDALTALQLLDDSIVADDAAFTPGTTKVNMVGFEYDDTTPDSVDEGDAGAARMSANRSVYTQLRDAAGNERGVNVTAGNALTVDGSAVTQPISGTITANAGTGTLSVDATGSGNVPISGTVTANLSATDNAVLDDIAARTSDPTVGTDGAAGPASAVSIAGTASGGTLQELLADTDGHLQVDIVNTVALATSDGTDIGNVDVASVVPGTGASNLGKAEDAAHTTGDVGVMGLAVRRDADTALAGTDGDYAPFQVDANGYLKVEIFDGGGSHTVDDGGTSLTIDNADITTIAGAVSGSEMQVDVVAALPAGTNAIGKLAANSGVDIGDVDVTSVIPGTGGTSLGKAIGAVAGSTDTGVASIAVRNDDLADLAGADGDWAPLQVTQNGALLMCPAANDDYKYAVVDEATSGNNTLVAAVASRKIRVLACFMVAAGDVVARFEDGAGGTALTGQMDLTTNSGFVLPFNPAGWFETSANTLLNLELDGAVSVDGSLTYIEVA